MRLLRHPSILATLVAVIARSPIRWMASAQGRICASFDGTRLPAGYGEVDAAILDWIAAEGRRISRRIVLM